MMAIENTNKMVLPLQLEWVPKEDITTYELAQCMPYLFRSVMPYEISDEDKKGFLRHFRITDNNDYSNRYKL